MKNSFNDLTYKELLNKKEELSKKFLDVRMNGVLGNLENPVEKRTLRRSIARVNTLIHEYKLGIRGQEK